VAEEGRPGYSGSPVDPRRWTDDRLDDLAEAIRSGFDRVDRDIRDLRGEILGVRGEVHGVRTDIRSEVHGVRTDLRSEVHGVRTDLRGEVHGVRTDLRSEISNTRAELKAEIAELHQWMFRMTIGMTVGFISVLAAILARGG
jgi:predicted  nucleic acid-binding Zn-ribbon protein